MAGACFLAWSKRSRTLAAPTPTKPGKKTYTTKGAEASDLADAALAEVEVSSVGDNLSIGLLDRGGVFNTGLVVRDVVGLVDGDMNSYANKFTTYRAVTGWKNEGLWWELDLGAQFWLDEVFLYFNHPGEGASGSSIRNGGTGFAFLVSDGRRTPARRHAVSLVRSRRRCYFS